MNAEYENWTDMLTNYNVSSAKELRKSLNINFSPLKSLSTDVADTLWSAHVL